jgi:hypothetical protein
MRKVHLLKNLVKKFPAVCEMKSVNIFFKLAPPWALTQTFGMRLLTVSLIAVWYYPPVWLEPQSGTLLPDFPNQTDTTCP